MLSLTEKQSIPQGTEIQHTLDNTHVYTHSAYQVVKLYKIYSPWKDLNAEGGNSFRYYKRVIY